VVCLNLQSLLTRCDFGVTHTLGDGGTSKRNHVRPCRSKSDHRAKIDSEERLLTANVMRKTFACMVRKESMGHQVSRYAHSRREHGVKLSDGVAARASVIANTSLYISDHHGVGYVPTLPNMKQFIFITA
jgi:hypothetical protein